MKYFALVIITLILGVAQHIHAEMPPTIAEQQMKELNAKQSVQEDTNKPSCKMKNHVTLNRSIKMSDVAAFSALDDYCYCESNHFACNPNSPPPNCNCVCTKK